MDWYGLARAYAAGHGSLLVPRSYTAPNGKKLGRWIERQRAAFHGRGTCRITEEQVRLLDGIGMAWQLETRTPWDRWLALCGEYRRLYGSLNTAKKTVYRGAALGEWLSVQRRPKRREKLTPAQLGQLRELGIL